MAVIGAFDFDGLIVNHAELRGRSVLTNGLEQMRKYNPATGAFLPCVLRPFRQNVALAAAGAGNLNGAYVYRIVPYNLNEDEEGEAFPVDGEDVAAFTITVANQSVNINLAALRIDSPEITGVRIYRTVAAGSWPALALVGYQAAPFGVFNDNVADGDLDFENEGLDTLVQVPIAKPFIIQHRERLFAWGDIPYSVGQALVTNGAAGIAPAAGAVWGFHLEGKEFHAEGDGRAYIIDEYNPLTGNLTLTENYGGVSRATTYRICGDPDALIWTEPNDERRWAGANTRPVGGKEASKPSGLFSSRSGLVCPKDRMVYSLYYTSRPNYPPAGNSRVGLHSKQVGGLSHRTWRSIRGQVIGGSKRGIIAVGGGVETVSYDAEPWFTEQIALDDNGTQQEAFAVEWPEQQQYILFFRSNDNPWGTGCDKALVWHYLTGKFSYYRFLTAFLCGENFKDTDGADIIVLGDIWGYVWEFPSGHSDGPPEGIPLVGSVTDYEAGVGSPGTCILVDDNANFPTYGLGLAGVPVYIPHLDEWVIIASNTATELFLEECFDVAPTPGMVYYLGPIEFWYKTGWLDFGTVARVKKMESAFLVHGINEGSRVQFRPYINFSDAPTGLRDNVNSSRNEGDVDLGDETAEQKIMVGGLQFKHLALEFYSFLPSNPVSVFDVAYKLRAQDMS